MGLRTRTLFALAVSVLLAGCAWDNSPPPYHTVIKYDPSRAQTYVSAVPPTNAPSTHDWKTNQVVGVGYGTSAPDAAAPNSGTTGGAVSTPSGVSYGAAAGTASPNTPSVTPLANPTPTGTSPSLVPAPSGISAPQPASGLNRSSTSPSLRPQPGIGPTNTGSSLLFTNRLTPLTNSFTPNGLPKPTP
jgi:hypothetical protein